MRAGYAKNSSAATFQFIEASPFSRRREEYLDDEELRALQTALLRKKEAGDVIPGGGEIRKLRWNDSRRSKGKRGDLRVIYYLFLADEEIWLLARYGKGEMQDLSNEEKEHLRRMLESERAARREGNKK